MDLSAYFEKAKGNGILNTTNAQGAESTVYARVHITGEARAAFIMHNRQTRHNLADNPQAVYLFVEEGEGYHGKRLFLTLDQIAEEGELMEALKKSLPDRPNPQKHPYVLLFRVDNVLPLLEKG